MEPNHCYNKSRNMILVFCLNISLGLKINFELLKTYSELILITCTHVLNIESILCNKLVDVGLDLEN